MINLLSVGYSKLFKNLAFKVNLLIMALIPMFFSAVAVVKNPPDGGPLNGIYNTGMIFIGIMIGAFVSLYISQDYTEKTINNKIMAGYSRIEIYFADLIVTLSGALIMQLVCIAAASLIAIPACGMYTDAIGDVVRSQLLLFLTATVYTVVALFISTAINSKAYAVAVSLITVMIMLMAGIGAYDAVTRADEVPAQEVTTMDKVFDTLYLVLPQSQMYAVMNEGIPAECAVMMGCDAATITVMTALGLMMFKRKDIK